MNNKPVIVLAGNPNVGKTSLFNALTGSRQTVGNWPGVTVEHKSGTCTFQGQSYEVVDLPGFTPLVAARLTKWWPGTTSCMPSRTW